MRSIFQHDGKRTAFHIAFDLPISVTGLRAGLLVVVIRATVELNAVVIAAISVEWINILKYQLSLQLADFIYSDYPFSG